MRQRGLPWLISPSPVCKCKGFVEILLKSYNIIWNVIAKFLMIMDSISAQEKYYFHFLAQLTRFIESQLIVGQSSLITQCRVESFLKILILSSFFLLHICYIYHTRNIKKYNIKERVIQDTKHVLNKKI